MKITIKYEYEIQGLYDKSWETLTTEETYPEAKMQLKCYNENEPTVLHKIKKIKLKGTE